MWDYPPNSERCKLEEIVGFVNSLGAAYDQMGTKFEKLQDVITVLQARLDAVNLAEDDTGVQRLGVEKTFHDERYDAQGEAMRIHDNICNEIYREKGV